MSLFSLGPRFIVKNILSVFFFQIVYNRGAEAYNSEDWEGTIKHMEAALVEYIEEYERCELLCEGRYDHEAFPELYNAIAGNYSGEADSPEGRHRSFIFP